MKSYTFYRTSVGEPFAPYQTMGKLLSVPVHRTYITTLIATIFAVAAAAAQSRQQPAPPGNQTNQTLAVQVALDRAGFSPGEIDGRNGPKTRLAQAAYQQSGAADASVAVEPVTTYTIAPQDVAGPFIDRMPTDMMESAKLTSLSYASPLEALAEKFHSSQALLRQLNPGATWTAGETITVPNVEPFALPTPASEKPGGRNASAAKPAQPGTKATAGVKPAAPAVEIVISGDTKSLVVRDSSGKILMYAPVTIGSSNDPLPIGEWKVTGVSWNPVFNYNPDLFWDADPGHAKAKIAPGPNNPVGVVWIDISKEHFGLHGTPEPSTIGRTESHGCVRLTNWDAVKLARLVSPGTKVLIQ